MLRLAVLLFMATNTYHLCAQDTSSNARPPVFRQYLAAKYNIGLLGIFIGGEVAATVAPYNWLHIQTSYRAYEMALSGEFRSSEPHRVGWDVYVDTKVQFPIKNTFTGFSIGPYYNYGGGTLTYKERLGQHDAYYKDRFEFRRHIVGATASYVYCFGKKMNLLLEVYFGGGGAVHVELMREPLEHSLMSDHTSAALEKVSHGIRGGFCIGYVFL